MGFPKSLVRQWMKQAHLNQQGLAEVLGLSKTTISLVFKGQRHLSPEAADRLARLSGIPVEKLLTGGDAARIVKLLGEHRNSAA